jgi:tRNA threonylcarbamoyladenosine biosynthesis protein TsaB
VLLAIDTATKYMSVALHDGNTLLGEQTWLAGNRHTTTLAPTIAEMVKACEVKLSDVSAVAVAIGPGSYTGLRIGVSFAKGLAGARKLPLIGMTTLDLTVQSQPANEQDLLAVVQAGRGRVIVNKYQWRANAWRSESEPRLLEWGDVVTWIDAPTLVTGEIDQDGRDALATVADVTLIAPAFRLRRAGFLAEYAWEQLRQSSDVKRFDALSVMPVYLQMS